MVHGTIPPIINFSLISNVFSKKIFLLRFNKKTCYVLISVFSFLIYSFSYPLKNQQFQKFHQQHFIPLKNILIKIKIKLIIKQKCNTNFRKLLSN